MYATAQDIIDLYTEDELLIVADRDDNGSIDAAIVDKALSGATAVIDGYLGQRHQLPLATPPPRLQEVCIDIAMYRLSAANGYTDEKRQRYDDAIRWLEHLAAGKVGLGLPDVDGGDDTPDPDVTIEITSNERLFNRRTGRKVF